MATQKNIPKEGRESGFSLIEVMVAMAILSVGILAVVQLQYANINGNTNANVITQEGLLAQLVMERLKSRSTPPTSGGSLNNVTFTGQAGGGYNANWSVSNPMGGSKSRLITVTVIHTGGVGGHPLTIRSLTMGKGI